MPACPQCRAEVPSGARVCPLCHALLPLTQGACVIARGVTIERGYGRLVVDTRLGEGGMGVVYRAWLFRPPLRGVTAPPPQLVALKVLRPNLKSNPDIKRLFLNEAEAMRRLSHPNVVSFQDFFEHEGALVLAIEHVDGNTLEEVVARHVARARLAGGGTLPGMPFRRAWYYFQQLLGALAAIHELSIVHRDVKPSNLLVRRDGIVKLTDFGIARLAATGTTGRFAPGTAAYMAPEQVMGLPLDGRSDLYGAATVLYEMLTGRTPFVTEGRSDFMLRQDQVETAPPPLRTFLPQAPPVLDALFSRALAKDPGARFASAIVMGDAFRSALGIPDGGEWRALVELALQATTPTTPEVDREARMATLRNEVVERVRTARMFAA